MKKSTLSAIAAVSVAGVFAIGLGAVSDWYKNWDTSTWFGRGGHETVQPEQPDQQTPDVGGAVISNCESNGISVMSAKLPRAAYAANGISEQAETAFVLTATIEPNNVDDKTVDWEIQWADGASLASEPVTNYVTVTPTSDGSLTARVACIRAFRGSSIYIKVTSRAEPTVYAVCNVTYLGIPSAISASDFTFNTTKENGNGSVPITLSNEFNDVGNDFYSANEISWTYTVSGTVTIGDFNFGNFSIVNERSVSATKDMVHIEYSAEEKAFSVYLLYENPTDEKLLVLSGSNHSVTVSLTIKCRDASKTITGRYSAAVNSLTLDNTTIEF